MVVTLNAGPDKKVLKGKYFGQKLPGMKPEVFLPGVVSTGMSELNAVFTPDHRLFYHSIRMPSGKIVIMEMRREGEKWSVPEVASFSGIYSDADPFITKDGKWLYFISRRPAKAGGKARSDWDIWRMKRAGKGWGSPARLPEPINSEGQDLYPGLSSDGDLYFGSRREGTVRGGDVFYAKKSGDGFEKPVPLDEAVNAGSEGDLYISPEEDYLIFVSRGRAEGSGLYISFRKDNKWGKPVNMGRDINITGGEYCPMVSQDGKYLFFTSPARPENTLKAARRLNMKVIKQIYEASVGTSALGRGDVYWMDAGIIERYRRK